MSATATQLEYSDVGSNSSKFYRVLLDDRTMVTLWGRRGGKGQSKVEQFRNGDAAAAMAAKVLRSKRLKGYEETAKVQIQVSLPSGRSLGEYEQAALESAFQSAVSAGHSSDVPTLSAAASEPVAWVARLQQWQEWRRTWEWADAAAEVLEGHPHHYDKSRDTMVVLVSRSAGTWIRENWVAADLTMSTEEDGASVLETAMMLWDARKSDGIEVFEDALEVARAL